MKKPESRFSVALNSWRLSQEPWRGDSRDWRRPRGRGRSQDRKLNFIPEWRAPDGITVKAKRFKFTA